MQPNSNTLIFSPQPLPDTNPRPIPVTSTSPYADTGCIFSPSCLSCPLPSCIEDLRPRQVAALKHAAQAVEGSWKLHARVQELLDMGITKDAACAMLAAEDGVTVRAIYRRLHHCKSASPPSRDDQSLEGPSPDGLLCPGSGDRRTP